MRMFLIVLFLAFVGSIGTSVEGEPWLFLVFFLLRFVIIYLMIWAGSKWLHRIGKNAAKMNRKIGSKYEKTLGSEYIRELPEYYTPALVSFIADQAVEYNKDIMATILHLINNNYLEISNNELIVTTKKNNFKYKHEKYVYDCILNKNKPDFNIFKNNLIEDATGLGLLKKANNSKYVMKGISEIFFGRFKFVFIFMILMFLVTPIMTMSGSFLDGNGTIIAFMIIIFLFTIGLPIIMFRGFSKGLSYIVLANTRKVDLSDAGKKDQEKIYMFKNFLKEFTMMNKKDVKDIYLWDEYLTYALVLEVNKKIYEDDKLKNIVNKVNNIIIAEWKNEVLS